MASTKFDGVWKLLKKYIFETDEDSTNDNLKCLLCKRLMIDACVSSCSCQYCHKCIADYLSRGNRFCPGGKEECNEEYLLMEQHVHRNKTLNNRIYQLLVKCPLCQLKVVLLQMDEHLKACVTSQCPYISVGCRENNVETSNLLSHIDSATLEHSRLLIECIRGLKEEVKNKDIRIQCLEDISRKKDIQMMALMRDVMDIKQESLNMKNAMETLEKRVDSKESSLKGKTEKRVCFTPSIEMAQDRKEKANVTRKTSEPEIKTDYAIGVLNFSIEHYSSRKFKNDVILSPHFYSHNNGYKLQLRIYPGGYADRNDCLSVHFIICKGEHDDKLSWPCNYSINISVVNQSTGEPYNNRKYDVLNVADVGRDMFNKPNIKDNKPCGHNTFISHKELEHVPGLIFNDSVIIRCLLSAPV